MQQAQKITELHTAAERQPVHPADLLKEVIPRKAWTPVVNAIIAGLKKHKEWDSTQPRKAYVEHMLNHLCELDAGETWDKDDGHHHASAMIVRGFQILDSECGNGG